MFQPSACFGDKTLWGMFDVMLSSSLKNVQMTKAFHYLKLVNTKWLRSVNGITRSTSWCLKLSFTLGKVNSSRNRPSSSLFRLSGLIIFVVLIVCTQLMFGFLTSSSDSSMWSILLHDASFHLELVKWECLNNFSTGSISSDEAINLSKLGHQFNSKGIELDCGPFSAQIEN